MIRGLLLYQLNGEEIEMLSSKGSFTVKHPKPFTLNYSAIADDCLARTYELMDDVILNCMAAGVSADRIVVKGLEFNFNSNEITGTFHIGFLY